MTVSNYEANFKKYGIRVGLKEIHPHMLRNNFSDSTLRGHFEVDRFKDRKNQQVQPIQYEYSCYVGQA